MGNIFKCCRGNVKPSNRIIVPNHVVEESIRSKNHPNHGYASNRIKTTKYTIITFLPKNLFEQFHRFANLYFIFVVALNWVPEVAAFGKELAMVPVIFVLCVTAIKDAFEDFRRYKSDTKINHTHCRIYDRGKQRYVQTEWSQVHPGDLVHLSCNEIIPADMILLRSNDSQGICHIETSNIDGETNLKQRHAVLGLGEEPIDPANFQHSIEVEMPNTDFYRFRGTMMLDTGEKVPVNPSNVLLRGCVIRNTDFVEAIVVYAGHETKAMLNNKGPRYKRSRLETKINRDVIWCVILLLGLCFFCAVGSGIWLSEYKQGNLVPFLPFGDLGNYSPLYQGFIVFWTYIIIFQAVIPLPLYVSVELVKLGQVYFLHQDLDLYHPDTDRPVECRALNITEELGQIEYIFSDKTGTLTENKMEFKTCTIGGEDFPHTPAEDAASFGRQSMDSRHSLGSFSRTSSIVENLNMEPRIQKALRSLTRQCLGGKIRVSKEDRCIHDFFVLLAVCNTVVTTTHGHEDAMDEMGSVNDGLEEEVRPEPLDLLRQSTTMSDSPSRPSASVAATRASTLSLNSMDSLASNLTSSSQHREVLYEAESPDELALVKAANTYDVSLRKRTPNAVTIRLPDGSKMTFKVLHVLAFDATRKRMSIILQSPDSQEITLLTKGADSSILSVLDRRFIDSEEGKEINKKTINLLEAYAKKGLRTLCMAKRVLSKEVYSNWLKQHKEAETGFGDRDKEIFDSACRIEQDLELLGATGIEDRLQEGVPETIHNLRRAGINIWVLTGDKQETAIQIAYACKLFSENQQVITINAKKKEETRDLLKHHLEQVNRDQPTVRTRNSLPSLEDSKQCALVIDGKTLAFTLSSDDMEKDFIELTKMCSSVVCCRATPIQKANVVRAVQKGQGKVSLAVGDGANDVSMIQSAEVGVGISGQEGMQAVMASDFAIARFRFLEKLLLVHGHWSYHRLAKFADFMFYKSLVSVFVVFWYQLFSGFSGSLMIDSLYLMLEHILFTSLPPIINGIFDRHVPAHLLLDHPELYHNCQQGLAYTPWTFLYLTVDSLYQSIAIYFLPHFSYEYQNVGIWEFGTTQTVCLILTILLHIGTQTVSWTWIQWLSLVLSFLTFWMFAVVSNAFLFTFDHPSNPYFVMENTIATPIHSCIVVITSVVALIPRLLVYSMKATVGPDEMTLLRQRYREQREADWRSAQTTANGVPDSQQDPVSNGVRKRSHSSEGTEDVTVRSTAIA